MSKSIMKIQRNHRSRGFTLIEVLVAMGVSLLLGLCVLGTFIQSRRSFEHAAGTIELVQATRPAMDRLTQYLTTAVAITGEETIVYPGGIGGANDDGGVIVGDDPSTWPQYMIFRTTEDFLSPTFDPDEIMNLVGFVNHTQLMETYKTEAQPIYDYILWWEGDRHDHLPDVEQGLVIGRVQQLVDGSGNTVFRDPSVWGIPGSDPWADLEPSIDPRIIARGEHLEEVNFMYPIENGMNVSIRAQTQVRSQVKIEDKEFRLEGMIQLPAITLE
jgi:prepilin-type N-terminal cleavage/methylation domain-containing protein